MRGSFLAGMVCGRARRGGSLPAGRFQTIHHYSVIGAGFWSIFGILTKTSDVPTDGRAPSLEAAKAEVVEFRTAGTMIDVEA